THIQNGSRYDTPGLLHEAPQAAGLDCRREWMVGVNEDEPLQAWYEATRSLLERHPQIDALLIHHAVVCGAVFSAAQDAGRCIGHDLAVVGSDDLIDTAWQRPGLTVIAEPVAVIAEALCDQALRGLQGRPSQVVTLESDLLIRGSSTLVQ
ncbi:MAG: substrate-binding domain-containing protein, partial [Planctomycetota bacterium]